MTTLAGGAAATGTTAFIGPLNTGTIVLDGGVPVGGSASLTIHQDGTYTFTGQFHDSGFVGYTVTLAYAVISKSGKVFTFSHSSSVAGTVTSGSRTDAFASSGTNQDVATDWENLASGAKFRWQASASLDLTALVNALVAAVQAAGTVVGAIIKVV